MRKKIFSTTPLLMKQLTAKNLNALVSFNDQFLNQEAAKV